MESELFDGPCVPDGVPGEAGSISCDEHCRHGDLACSESLDVGGDDEQEWLCAHEGWIGDDDCFSLEGVDAWSVVDR